MARIRKWIRNTNLLIWDSVHDPFVLQSITLTVLQGMLNIADLSGVLFGFWLCHTWDNPFMLPSRSHSWMSKSCQDRHSLSSITQWVYLQGNSATIVQHKVHSSDDPASWVCVSVLAKSLHRSSPRLSLPPAFLEGFLCRCLHTEDNRKSSKQITEPDKKHGSQSHSNCELFNNTATTEALQLHK